HDLGTAHPALEAAGPGLDAGVLSLAVQDAPVELADEADLVERAELGLEFGRGGEAFGRLDQGHAALEPANPAAEPGRVGQTVERGIVEPGDLGCLCVHDPQTLAHRIDAAPGVFLAVGEADDDVGAAHAAPQ